MKGKLPLSALYCLTIGGLLLAVIWGSRAITVISENMPVERQHCIIIDAGHGGEDGGATSCTGKLESSFNLEISLRLNDLLHLLGYDTAMIRTSDVSIYTKGETIAQKKVSDLKERVRIANETENALLLSIHQNTYPESRYSGAQVFYANTAGSQQLAKELQSGFAATVNQGSNRKSKKADGIYLMEHISCTGILVECGFLSNPEEEARLRSAEYQKKICCVIASSVSTYLSNT
jgi:N-acetylmuramoyl-L-alanine amidase